MHHKTIITFCILFACFSFLSRAQNDTIWFDQDWNETSKYYAEFFRPQPKLKNGKYLIKDYYINGQLQMKGLSIRQDSTFFDGLVTHYYKSGETKSTVQFKNGKPHGKATQYFENGSISLIVPYNDGVEHGTYKAYHKNGNLRGRIDLKNNIRDGLYEEYYENGNKRAFIIYKDGKVNGDFIEYFENGNIRYAAYQINNMLQGVVKVYDFDGKLNTQGQFIDNKKEGLWTSFGGDEYIIKRNYKDDILNGNLYYESTKTESSIVYYYKGNGTYKNGKLIAWDLRRAYLDDYTLYRSMTMENNKTIWKNYDDKEQLESKVIYNEDGIEDGSWLFYYPNSKVKHHVNFLAEDCLDRELNYAEVEDVEETVIESAQSYEIETSKEKPTIPKTYLPNLLLEQESFSLEYKCKASAYGDYLQFDSNGNPILKTTFENGQLKGDVILFDQNNKKSLFSTENHSDTLSKLVILTPIKTEDYVKIDYSDIEPNPFEMIVYYSNDYGETKFKRVVVHPLLNKWISNLPVNSEFYINIQNSLNTIEDLNFSSENFPRQLYYHTENYKESSNN
ncbi:toxin-antitoxin system YwqK family antitoxin [Psychroserpens sp. MEBiC05023]